MIFAKPDRAFARPKRKSAVRRAFWPMTLAGLVGVISFTAGAFAPEEIPLHEENEVTRAGSTVIVLPPPIPSMGGDPVSTRLRQPVRVTDRDAVTQDLSALVRGGLADLAYIAEGDDALLGVLVLTLAEGQTDAYIDVALNAALRRGAFDPTPEMMTADGALDTSRVLRAVLAYSAGS